MSCTSMRPIKASHPRQRWDVVCTKHKFVHHAQLFAPHRSTCFLQLNQLESIFFIIVCQYQISLAFSLYLLLSFLHHHHPIRPSTSSPPPSSPTLFPHHHHHAKDKRQQLVLGGYDWIEDANKVGTTHFLQTYLLPLLFSFIFSWDGSLSLQIFFTKRKQQPIIIIIFHFIHFQ